MAPSIFPKIIFANSKFSSSKAKKIKQKPSAVFIKADLLKYKEPINAIPVNNKKMMYTFFAILPEKDKI